MVHLKILGPRKMMRHKFSTEDPQILGTIIQNLAVWVTWSPWSVPPYYAKIMQFFSAPCAFVLSVSGVPQHHVVIQDNTQNYRSAS